LIVEYYTERYAEADRLSATARGRLEYERTLCLLRRLLPSAPARVLDIGGGTGIYAKRLAAAGYDVHLVDLTPAHVDAARSAGLSAAVGDARDLAEPDGAADVVLLLGPLYHLTELADRGVALAEARRTLRPRGLVAVATISRYAALLSFGARGELTPDRLALARPGLHSGVHDPRLSFTTAYFHTPDEIRAELIAAGFRDVAAYAIEGPLWPVVDRDPGAYDSAVAAARETETDQALLPVSQHLLTIGRA
jgi:SAM-dependent methyltransferase